MAKYGVRNSFLFPTALKMMMKAVPRPRERFDLRPAHDHERRRSGRHDGVRLGARGARRHDQRDVRADRDELHRRQFAGALAGQAGIDGPPVSGAPDRGDRRRRPRGRRGRDRRSRGPSHRAGRRAGPGLLPGIFQESRRHREEIHRRLVPHRRSRAARRRRLSLVPGPRRRHVQGGRIPDRPVGDRELPRPAPGGGQRRRRARRRTKRAATS